MNDAFDSSGASGIGMFVVDVGDPGAVANLGSSTAWAGYVGVLTGEPSLVSWQAEEFQATVGIGQSADFWFTTPPTAVIASTGFVSDSGFAFQAGGAAVAPAPGLLVTTNLDEETNNGLTSLREAIVYANGLQNLGGQQRIGFASNLAGATITLDSTKGELRLTKSMYIDGPASKITVQRDPATAIKHRIFRVESTSTSTIARMNLLNGETGETVAAGGAVRSDGKLTVQDCQISQNKATGSLGGGIAATGGSLDVIGCTLTGNSAAQGGAIFIGQRVTTTISSSAIVLNTAVNGGGIYIESSTTANPTSVTLNAVDVNGNRADEKGGGIFASVSQGAGTTLTLGGSTHIHNNVSLSSNPNVGKGGGLYFGQGTLFLFGVTFEDNSAANGDGMYRRTGTVIAPFPVVTYINDVEVVGS